MSPLRPAVLACALLALLVPAASHSQSATAVVGAVEGKVYVFEAVDSVETLAVQNRVLVQGVLVGESAPTTVSFYYAPLTSDPRTFERCERTALLALSKPGQFLLELRQERPIGYGSSQIACKLTRR